MAAPPFVLLVPPRPVYTDAVIISPTQFAFTILADSPVVNIAVFLTPGATLPQDTLAGIYAQLPWTGADFKLLGGLSNDEPSAIFALPGKDEENSNAVMGEEAMTGAGANDGPITVGISIEAAATLLPQISALPSQQLNSTSSTALIRSRDQTQTGDSTTTKVLAQRIIGNAFNFLASFSGSVGPGGEEVVPLKTFRDWWTKFEKKIQLDPGFLEREVDA